MLTLTLLTAHQCSLTCFHTLFTAAHCSLLLLHVLSYTAHCCSLLTSVHSLLLYRHCGRCMPGI